MLWGHRNDPVNFHRCLQDFDRRLPDMLEALRARRPARSSRPTTAATRRRRRPTTRASTRCCSPTPPAATRRGGSTRTASSPTSARRCNAWLGGEDRRQAARRAGRSSSRDGSNDPRRRRAPSTRRRTGSRRGRAAYEDSTGRMRRELAFEAVAEVDAAHACSRSAAGRASSRSGSAASSAAEVVAVDISPRMVELARARGVDARVGDVRSFHSRTQRSTASSPPGCCTTSPTSTAALAELARVLRPGGRLVAVTNCARSPAGAVGRCSAPTGALGPAVQSRERRRDPRARISSASSGETPRGTMTFADIGRRSARYFARRDAHDRSASTAPGARRRRWSSRAAPVDLRAEKR